MGGYDDFFDVIQAIFYLRIKQYRCLARRLRMELCRKTNLEKDVFHHVRAITALEAELAFLFRLDGLVLVGLAEQHIVEAPLGGGERSGNSHFTTQSDIRKTHRPACGVPRCPGLS